MRTASVGGAPVRTSGGLTVMPDGSLEDALPAHTLVIPGDGQLPGYGGQFAGVVGELADAAGRVAAISTGVFLLAATGPLRGRRVTTHWKWCDLLSERHADVQVDRAGDHRGRRHIGHRPRRVPDVRGHRSGAGGPGVQGARPLPPTRGRAAAVRSLGAARGRTPRPARHLAVDLGQPPRGPLGTRPRGARGCLPAPHQPSFRVPYGHVPPRVLQVAPGEYQERFGASPPHEWQRDSRADRGNSKADSSDYLSGAAFEPRGKRLGRV
ncbi:DJ-1/PfpI family protein [Streptomyces sp. NPDC050844]|uniref:DJ-1/PfpI family protein n=1 Tax=Streptomyces sp. NPDC050844 TaxID=3155790 RepID=UPI003405F1BB